MDGYLDTDEETDALLSAGGGLKITNVACVNVDADTLLTRYEEAVKAGNLEEVPGHPVKRESPQTDDSVLTRAMIDGVLKAVGGNLCLSHPGLPWGSP